MKKAKNLFYFLSILLVASIFSCKGPAGEDGIDGTDGQNGNANVTIVTLASSNILWTSGYYLGRPANTYTLTAPGVTQDIIDHGTVLGYCYVPSTWLPLPFYWMNTDGTNTQCVTFSYELNAIKIYAYNTAGVFNPMGISQYRFLLITDNTVLTKSTEPENVIEKLTNAGVDVNNYYDVLNYFGLEE